VFAGYERSSPCRALQYSLNYRLVLMTYHGVVLLLSGYQADEAHMIKQYKAIVSRQVIFFILVSCNQDATNPE
jgi:hypothetical protein